ncbi:MAG: NADH-quinone oxidoreductase subunit H, partial [Chloroflexi bacterium]|nr:NADH-quinone oxidoreductase subunit H [Chloroflexota bacterium]
EYIKMVAVSAIATALFFGGYLGPFLNDVPSWLAGILGVIYFSAKTIFFLFCMLWIRATLPRLRYDQLMRFGWKVMLPLALASIAITAVFMAIAG